MGMITALKSIPKAVTKGCANVAFKFSKNKPQLAVGAGLVITIGGFAWAVWNARKIDRTIEESNNKLDELKDKKTEMEMDGNPEAEIKAIEKEILKVRADGIKKMFVLMGIPVIVFSSGLCLIFFGHKLLVRRFGELSAAFATLQQTYDRYRQMNIDEHGEECDRRYRYGIVGETEVETKVTDENGDEHTVKCKVPVVDSEKRASIYSFEFSEDTSSKCPKDPVSTIAFLRSQETYWNSYMKGKHKPVTLYMVLDEIGLELDPDDPRNDWIFMAGWRPNGDGDNHIDFGIMRAVNKPALRMEENVVMLDFNCDGNLYHSTRYDRNGKKVC